MVAGAGGTGEVMKKKWKQVGKKVFRLYANACSAHTQAIHWTCHVIQQTANVHMTKTQLQQTTRNGFLCELIFPYIFRVCFLCFIWCGQHPRATGSIATRCSQIVRTLIIATAFIWPHKSVCYKTSLSILCVLVLNNVALSSHNVLISLLLYRLNMLLLCLHYTTFATVLSLSLSLALCVSLDFTISALMRAQHSSFTCTHTHTPHDQPNLFIHFALSKICLDKMRKLAILTCYFICYLSTKIIRFCLTQYCVFRSFWNRMDDITLY